MTLPNKITISRILLIPFFMFFLFSPIESRSFLFLGESITRMQFIAGLLFIIASSTDWVDGYVARKQNLVSDLGKFLDPLADKLLISAALIGLVSMHYVPAWVVILILSREFAVTGLRTIASNKGVVIAADRLGKWKTVFQIIAISLLLMNCFSLGEITLWIATILTVVSGIQYFVRNRQVFQ